MNNFHELRSYCHSRDYYRAALLVHSVNVSLSEKLNLFKYCCDTLESKEIWKSFYIILDGYYQFSLKYDGNTSLIIAKKDANLSELDEYNILVRSGLLGFEHDSGVKRIYQLLDKESHNYNSKEIDIDLTNDSWLDDPNFIPGMPYQGISPIMTEENPPALYYYVTSGKYSGKVLEIFDYYETSFVSDSIINFVYGKILYILSYYEENHKELPSEIIKDMSSYI